MTLGSLFKTTTSVHAPLDGSSAVLEGTSPPPTATAVSDFLTVQSVTNFAVMTAAIMTAWKSLERLDARLSTLWVPYGFAVAFGVVSVLISTEALKTGTRWNWGKVFTAAFIALINALVLASAVVGATVVTGELPTGET